jgi:superfamily II DNA or RNA helicase/predicted house-cleaning noncanonical NTP pyrophosphatase (MazG superfamily)
VYEKLVRDLIPQLARAEGRELPVRAAREAELGSLLSRKLVEEAVEVGDALASGERPALVEELADLYTVLAAAATRHGIGLDEVQEAARRKHLARGGFDAGLVLGEQRPKPSRLHVGSGTSLVDALRHELQHCTAAGFAVAFVMRSGLDLMEGALRAALLRGAQIQLLTTDYLDVTEPEALERVLDWSGRFEARVFSHPDRSFHPKAYWFERADGSGRAFIGSANFSRMGLKDGIEWTWSVLDIDPGHPMAEIRHRFSEFFHHPHAQPLSPGWLQDYRARRRPQAWTPRQETPAVQPRPVQSLALQELERLRADGESRALVIAATGLGKTFLAAFDAAGADRVLFLAHREELLQQAARAFATLYPGRSQGFVVAGREEIERDVVLGSVQTLSNERWLSRAELARFDYVVVDEFHHAAADSYARLLAVLQPRFLLGLTATPWRGDNRDLMALCHGNVAYEVGLFEAIAYGWLVPFRYFGVADVVAYEADMLTRAGTYDTTRLTLAFNTPERAALALAKYREHPSRAALGFCVSIEHANFMARAFEEAGVAAAAVHSAPGSMPRQQALEQLATGQLKVLFTVDLFNEGVDIPRVDLVMFLRPTESMVVFLQQLGRGLRLHEGKDYLTVLDFLANYRRAHFKLPFLVGTQGEDTASANAALRLLQQWQATGSAPQGVPENVRIELEPLALAALKESLHTASPLRELVLADLKELAASLSRMPTLVEVHRLGRYGPRQCMKALECRRWAEVAQRLELATDEVRALDAAAGDFLQELERTAMTKSFKMVVLLAMLQAQRFPHAIGMPELVAAFRRYFGEERHRLDVNGTRVEGAGVDDATWRRYLLDNPINAWTGGNIEEPGRYFAFDGQRDELRYVGARASDLDALRAAVLERVTWRLEDYWDRPRPGRFVYTVIPQGSNALCVMFGTGAAREGLPSGWHPVHINGRFLYGKFVKVALNVVKEQPTDDGAVPNLLAHELRQLLGLAEGANPTRSQRVRLVPLPAQDAWVIEQA